MSEQILPRYPVYIPSKARYGNCLTARVLDRDGVPFSLVVEASEADEYVTRFGEGRVLVLPWDGPDPTRRAYAARLGIEDGGLVTARNWIKDHATAAGHGRHWQLDDNMRGFYRRWKGQRLHCRAGVALAVVEDFVDRYENVAIAGMCYDMFAPEGMKIPPFYRNVHVYSCTLILNHIPYRWRIRYNDDTDICLQVLAAGWCTVLVNVFPVKKIRTMVVKGGNTTDLYGGDGRLRMARSLERLWPGVVVTSRKFNRPQHVIKDSWKKFNTPLKLKPGIDLTSLPPNEYGMALKQVRPIKSKALAELVADILQGSKNAQD